MNKQKLQQKNMLWAGWFVLCTLLFIIIIVSPGWVDKQQLTTALDQRNQSPSLAHYFGTDWLGRDMFTRTLLGLSLSIKIGIVAAFGSTVIACAVGISAAVFGGKVDACLSWLIDLFLSVPHLVALILISFTLGGGVKGVLVGLMVTHWPTLARVIRAEVMAIRSAGYVQISQQFGKSKKWIVMHHILPHILPQIIIGFLLLFPHAILHEAAISFLGLGLSPHEPAIGIILSESMKYLSSGMWWLAFFPGLMLLVVVRLFDRIGDFIKRLLLPNYINRNRG